MKTNIITDYSILIFTRDVSNYDLRWSLKKESDYLIKGRLRLGIIEPAFVHRDDWFMDRTSNER